MVELEETLIPTLNGKMKWSRRYVDNTFTIIKSEEIETHSNSNIKGNIKSKNATLGGKVKGNVNAEQINIKKTADIDGVLNQKTLSIEEGATLKIKTQTYK